MNVVIMENMLNMLKINNKDRRLLYPQKTSGFLLFSGAIDEVDLVFLLLALNIFYAFFIASF